MRPATRGPQRLRGRALVLSLRGGATQPRNLFMGFRLFGVNVEVHFTFWLTTLVLSLAAGRELDHTVLTWAVVVFVSILVHEYGHAFAVKAQGLEPEIRLHGMGGTTHYRVLLPLPRRAEIFISLAGPFAGFLLGGLILALDHFVLHTQAFHFRGGWFRHAYAEGLAGFAIYSLLWVNFGWGLVNLLPVLPFDGGHVLEAALGPKRVRVALTISLVFALAVAGFFAMRRELWAAFLFGMGAFHAVRRLQADQPVTDLSQQRAAPPREPPIPGEILAKLRAARRALSDDEYDQAARLANEAVKLTAEHGQPLPRAKVEAYEVLGWVAHLRGEEAEAARWVKAAEQHGTPDPALVAAMLIGRGETRDARKVLEQARASGDDRKEVVGPLVQILIAEGEVARASAVALDIIDSLSDDDARKMAEIAFGARAFDWAARLFEAVFARTKAADDAYEAARAHAADGANERALEYLSRAVKAGFSDRARAWSDAALEPLRAGSQLEAVVPRP